MAWRAAFLAAAALTILLLLASQSTLWDRDEPRFARAAVEMMRGGDYLVPTFNGQFRPDKPALVYWLMVGAMHLFGVNEFAVRCCSSLAMVSAGVLTFLIGRRLFDARVGLWAMAILLTNAWTIYAGSAALTDAVLLATITLAIFAFVEMLHTGMRWWRVGLLGGALGLALLAKGPVGLAIPLLTIIVGARLGQGHLTLDRRFKWGLMAAVLLGIMIFAAWAVPANIRSGGEFLRQGLGHHVVDRIAFRMEGVGSKGVVGYLTTLPIHVPFLIASFCPWTIHLPAALLALKGRRLGTPGSRAVLLGWIVPTFVLMSLIATKLPHYVLPIYPALSIATAAVLVAWERGELSEADRWWLRAGAWFFAPIAFGAAVTVVAWPWLVSGASAWPVMSVGAVAVAVAALVVRLQLLERLSSSSRTLLISIALLTLLGPPLVLPWVDSTMKITPALARGIRERVCGETPIYLAGYREPSLVFYLDRPLHDPVRFLEGRPETIASWATEPGPAVLVMQRQEFEAAIRMRDALQLTVLDARTAPKRSLRAKAVDVVVVGRNLNAALTQHSQDSFPDEQ